MHKSKNRHFYHIFVSPGYAPWAITLNVVRMEREFDAYKLSRGVCPSNYNRFWNRARYWSKIVIVSYSLALDAPAAITQNVAWMKRQFSACQTPHSMYPSIFNSFPVIWTASAKNRRFHVPQPTFLFPLETPLRLSRNMLHGKTIQCLPNASQHVPIHLQ